MSKNVTKAIFWSGVERFSTQLVQFVMAVILARLLTPDDFAVIAIVTVFTTIFQTINESGLNIALIHKLDRDDTDFCTSFVLNVFIGLLGYLIMFIIAPFIAKFYDNPILTPLTRYLSLTLIINSFGLIQDAKYTIQINFKTLTNVSLISAIISGLLGVFLAYYYKTVYALVAQTISYSLIRVMLLWLYSSWRPIFSFSLKRMTLLWNFSYKLILARLINVIYDDIYSLSIAKLYKPADLAYYNRARSFSTLIYMNITSIIQRVSTPILCEEQNDYTKLSGLLLKFESNTAFIVYPLLTLLSVLANSIVYIVLGEQWMTTVEMIYFVTPIGFLYLIGTFNRNIYNATGRTGLALKSEIIKKIIFLIVFIVTMHYSLQVLLIGLIVNSLIECIIDMTYTKSQIGLSILRQFKNLLPIIIACIISGISTIFCAFLFESHICKLFIGGTFGLFMYMIVSYIANINSFRDYILAKFCRKDA